MVLENELADLKTDLGVVDHEGNLSYSWCQYAAVHDWASNGDPRTLDKADDLARSSANLAQSASHALCVTSDSRTGGRCDA